MLWEETSLPATSGASLSTDVHSSVVIFTEYLAEMLNKRNFNFCDITVKIPGILDADRITKLQPFNQFMLQF